MIQTLIGKKIDQMQKFLENGKRIPVTKIFVADNAVLQVKTVDSDTYSAVQLGFGHKKNPTKALIGHSKKAGFDTVARVVREVRVQDAASLPAAGESLAVANVFAPGDIVTVTGTSKGKGFAGVVKRHNFRGGPKTHGQSDRERAPGSIGQTTTPGRVYRGKRMAGRMGSDTVSLPNLTVVAVDVVNKILSVSGLVPGHKEGFVTITKTGARKKFVPLLEEVEKEKAAAAAAEEAQAKSQAETVEVQAETVVGEEPTVETDVTEEKKEEDK